jgi:hypothetical protein
MHHSPSSTNDVIIDQTRMNLPSLLKCSLPSSETSLSVLQLTIFSNSNLIQPNKMSNHNSSSTFQSFSTSSFSSNINGRQTSYSESTYTDPSGTKVHRTTQNPGEERREERLEYDSTGRRLDSGDGGARARIEGNRVEDVTDKEDAEQKRRDQEYEERMEEEYAKREGGA